MEVLELKEKVIDALKNVKTDEIKVINVIDQTSITDYIVIIAVNNSKQTKKACMDLEEKLEKDGIKATRIDGYEEGRWIVVDYSDIIVHIFNRDTLGFYQLEKLWGTESNIEIIKI
ncbi:MAG: ribosome silencing factor [Clostridia bacterium]|nr:ribosome silencing factor [Clostridia bacterium]